MLGYTIMTFTRKVKISIWWTSIPIITSKKSIRIRIQWDCGDSHLHVWMSLCMGDRVRKLHSLHNTTKTRSTTNVFASFNSWFAWSNASWYCSKPRSECRSHYLRSAEYHKSVFNRIVLPIFVMIHDDMVHNLWTKFLNCWQYTRKGTYKFSQLLRENGRIVQARSSKSKVSIHVVIA